MKEQNYQDITDEGINILKEAGNIASGHAMTSLSQLMNLTLNMSVARVRVEKIQEFPKILGDPEEVIAGILINVYGDLNATLLVAFEIESAIGIVNHMLGENLKTFEAFDEMAYSALSEVGNILAGSYLSALNTFIGLKLDVSVPQIAIDMMGAILSFPASEFVCNNHMMLLIETSFQDVSGLFKGTYLLVFNYAAYGNAIKSLRIYDE